MMAARGRGGTVLEAHFLFVKRDCCFILRLTVFWAKNHVQMPKCATDILVVEPFTWHSVGVKSIQLRPHPNSLKVYYTLQKN